MKERKSRQRKIFLVAFLLSASLVVGLCVWVLVLRLFGPSRCWVLGGGLGCLGLFPRGWLLPLLVFCD